MRITHHRFVSTVLFLALPSWAWGHNEINLTPNTAVDAAMVVNYRSDSSVEKGRPWYVTGAMMGGEAVPASEDFSVDDLFITVTHVGEDNVYGLIKLASHQGSDAAFEHAWLGYRLVSKERSFLNIEAGRMAGLFSPANLQHSDSRLMSEANLALDVFLGRQYIDNGLRLLWGNDRGLSLGVETWQGEAFPATSGDGGGASDVFFKYQNISRNVSWSVGGWYMQAKAASRSDTRYESGHSHGVVVDDIEAYWFDGDTSLYGVHLDVQWQVSSRLTFGLDTEWLWQKVDGSIRDETRIAKLESEANGGWIEPSISFQRHTVGLRYEQMVLNNEFSGVAGEALAALAHLNNTGHNPTRSTLVYRYQIQPTLALRAELLSDKSLPQREERWLVGLIWEKNLWRLKKE